MNLTRLVTLALLVVVGVTAGCSGHQPRKGTKHGLASSAWPRFGGNAANSGLGSGCGATGKRMWVFQAGKVIDGSPALGPDGTVYVWCYDGYLYAIRHRTGKQKWRTRTLNFSVLARITRRTHEGIDAFSPAPALGANGLVYISSQDGHLYALDANTGARKWRFATGDWIESSPSIGPDGTVYIISRDSNLYAVNGDTGRMKWKHEVGLVQCYPAVGSDGTVYVGTSTRMGASGTSALDGATGRTKWECPGVTGQIALSRSGTLYVADDQKVYAVDANTGSKIWEYAMRGVIGSTPAIGRDGTVYVGSVKGLMCALDGANGRLRWKFRCEEGPLLQPCIASDGTVYVAGRDRNAGCIYALDPRTGHVKWQADAGNGLNRAAAIGADGTIYIGSWEGKVYAIH